MKIQIEIPVYFTKIGQRLSNEDYVFPPSPNKESNLFMVCDGIGGMDKGEEASIIVAESIKYYFEQQTATVIDKTQIADAIHFAHEALKSYVSNSEFINRMGSTLALLHINQYGALIAHIGDSRIYHLRGNNILFKSTDHKQVLELVNEGIITHEQAQTHPWRNRLSRSISIDSQREVNSYQKADIIQITDIEAGDCFFLCTDGVLEQIDDEILRNTLNNNASTIDKLNAIYKLCDGKTRDNFSAYLIQVSEVIHSFSNENSILSTHK